jgi:hypothetical protein
VADIQSERIGSNGIFDSQDLHVKVLVPCKTENCYNCLELPLLDGDAFF